MMLFMHAIAVGNGVFAMKLRFGGNAWRRLHDPHNSECNPAKAGNGVSFDLALQRRVKAMAVIRLVRRTRRTDRRPWVVGLQKAVS
jgi:hypothetical protein